MSTRSNGKDSGSRVCVGLLAATLLTMVGLAQPAAAQTITAKRTNHAAAYGNASIARRPTVSPYLNLLVPQTNGAFSSYQTLVRPMLDQQQMNQQQLLAMQRMDVQSGRPMRSPPSSGWRSTNATTRYLNYSHYFPTLASPGREEPSSGAR